MQRQFSVKNGAKLHSRCVLQLVSSTAATSHSIANFETKKSIGAGPNLVFWDEMFLGTLEIFCFLVNFLEEIFQILYQSYGDSSDTWGGFQWYSTATSNSCVQNLKACE